MFFEASGVGVTHGKPCVTTHVLTRHISSHVSTCMTCSFVYKLGGGCSQPVQRRKEKEGKEEKGRKGKKGERRKEREKKKEKKKEKENKERKRKEDDGFFLSSLGF